MTKYLGPFLLLLSLNSFADTNTVLVLRAYVPEVTKIEVKMEKNGPRAIVRSNHKGRHLAGPKFLIKKHSSHYLVSVTHP